MRTKGLVNQTWHVGENTVACKAIVAGDVSHVHASECINHEVIFFPSFFCEIPSLHTAFLSRSW